MRTESPGGSSEKKTGNSRNDAKRRVTQAILPLPEAIVAFGLGVASYVGTQHEWRWAGVFGSRRYGFGILRSTSPCLKRLEAIVATGSDWMASNVPSAMVQRFSLMQRQGPAMRG